MRPPPRSMTILDAMIMIAAVGAWFALARLWARESDQLPAYVTRAVMPIAGRTQFGGWALSALIPWTFAVLTMILRRPRPRLWVLARQPGAVACGVAAVMLVLEVANLPLTLSTMGGLTSPLLVASWYWPTSVGSAVLASWWMLALRGPWRVGSDWLSRSGSFVGFCWIALPPALMCVEFLLR